MTQTNTTTDEAAEQRHAELLRKASEQGIRPLRFDKMLGDAAAGDPEKEDVDDFIAQRREWRAAELCDSQRSFQPLAEKDRALRSCGDLTELAHTSSAARPLPAAI